MRIFDFEFVSLEDLQEEDLQYEFDECCNEEDVLENLEEHEATLLIAELLEELGYGEA